MNPNSRAQEIAALNGKPVIATADVHVLKKLNTDFAYIDVDGFSPESVFAAIRQNDFENITAPKRFFDIALYTVSTCVNYAYAFLAVKILHLRTKKLLPVEI
jgi:PHP family Zn ribbon phosphoesterase